MQRAHAARRASARRASAGGRPATPLRGCMPAAGRELVLAAAVLPSGPAPTCAPRQQQAAASSPSAATTAARCRAPRGCTIAAAAASSCTEGLVESSTARPAAVRPSCAEESCSSRL